MRWGSRCEPPVGIGLTRGPGSTIASPRAEKVMSQSESPGENPGESEELEQRIFAQALEKTPGAERTAFLEEACASAEMRARLETLLAAYERAGTKFLESPPPGLAGDVGRQQSMEVPGALVSSD